MKQARPKGLACFVCCQHWLNFRGDVVVGERIAENLA